MSVRVDSSPSHSNGRVSISSVLSIENVGKAAYKCQYKNHHIEYSELKLNETRAHSIYENFNEIRYELFKYWFYNHKSFRPSTTTEPNEVAESTSSQGSFSLRTKRAKATLTLFHLNVCVDVKALCVACLRVCESEREGELR